MKILIYATPNSEGHHSIYFDTLVTEILKYNNIEVIAVLPQKYEKVKCKQIYIDNIDWGSRKYRDYFKLMNQFIKIVKKEKPDLIHIQCGDNFYRFFGLGFSRIKKFNPIITFHHMRRSFFRDIALKVIFKNVYCGVVHTKSLKIMLNNMGITNVRHVEYPQMTPLHQVDSNNAKEYFGLKAEIPVLAAIGGTREDKGLDILLDSLEYISQSFQLLIAGSESTFTKDYILNSVKNYSDNVIIYLKYLSDDELNLALNAADIIVLPYKKIFDGASGPLGEGCYLRKCIIGPNHGSLGEIIETNKLGLTFETENSIDLANKIEYLLNQGFQWNKEAEEYRDSLSPKVFINKYQNIFIEILDKKTR